MSKTSFIKTLIVLLGLLSSNSVVFSAETTYTLLEPGVFGGGITQVTSFSEYASSVFGVLLTVAIALAILMIVLGGFQYVTSASGLGKSDGKDKIKDAITGLIIILISYLILETINPKLVKWDFTVEPLGTPTTQTTTTNPPK